MPEEEQAHLVFAGPTVLARVFCALEKGGYPCTIVSAPGSGSPCGLALAIRQSDLSEVLDVLHALGVTPYRPVASETPGKALRG